MCGVGSEFRETVLLLYLQGNYRLSTALEHYPHLLWTS